MIFEPEKSNTRAVSEVNGGCKMRFLREAAGTYASVRFSDNLPPYRANRYGKKMRPTRYLVRSVLPYVVYTRGAFAGPLFNEMQRYVP